MRDGGGIAAGIATEYRGRDEIGGVYLPSQLERTLQLVRDG
jgi:hypothetical protein